MPNVKQEVEQLLNKLPDDCSVEDIQYHLYVLDKVRLGLEDARLNGSLSQQEVEAHLMIDIRYDELKSGRVKAVDGEEAFADLRRKSKARRRP